MIFARTGAVIFVILLLGSLTWAGVAVASWLGPMSAHGTNVMHVNGQVTNVGPGRDFTFKTAAGTKMSFVCTGDCRASQRHLVRHLKEKAPTDVYYIPSPNHQLVVVDAD
jgi:hypothetical protein